MYQRLGDLTRKLLLILCAFLAFNAQANVVGADTQNFNPTTSGLDFVTVHSSETLRPGIINFGFFLNYAVNSLPNYEDTTTQSRTNFSDALFSADMNVGVGLMPNWDVGLSIPYLLAQSVDSESEAFRGEFAQTGLTEYRINTKYRLSGDESGGFAVIGSVNMNQIEDNPFTGVGAGPTLNVELAADTTIDKIALGGNIGYRLRSPGDPVAGVPIEPFGDQVIASLAVSYLTSYDTKLIGEIFGGIPVNDQMSSSDRDLSTFELLLGMKTDIRHDMALHVGGGTEILHGTSSPDWRVYAGLNWTLGPLFAEPQDVIVKVDDRPVKSLSEINPEDPFAGIPGTQETFVARDVLFEFNSDQVEPRFKRSLQRLVDYLNSGGGFQSLTIVGHTDSVGSARYNQNLSRRRAQSVRRVLVQEMGVPARKVRAQGRGESEPIADNGNYQGRALNRRVEFNIIR